MCTPECQQRFKEWQEKVEAYAERWPNYCQDCNGAGGRTFRYDPSPAGVALSPGYMVDFDPCSNCIEKGDCPRCGGAGTVEDDEPCSKCGWNWGKGSDDARPEPPECFCYEEEMWKAEHPNWRGDPLMSHMTERMIQMLEISEQLHPNSRLTNLYRLVVKKGAYLDLDTMWRLTYKGDFYSANRISELFLILEKEG